MEYVYIKVSRWLLVEPQFAINDRPALDADHKALHPEVNAPGRT